MRNKEVLGKKDGREVLIFWQAAFCNISRSGTITATNSSTSWATSENISMSSLWRLPSNASKNAAKTYEED